jgi:hypothetical protein
MDRDFIPDTRVKKIFENESIKNMNTFGPVTSLSAKSVGQTFMWLNTVAATHERI